MIQRIRIQNFAIIENLEVEFHPGLNILTGETGAGKSIIIEAVSLALGSRADTTYIRTGKDKAVVQLMADLDGEDYIITREIQLNGKNVCRINDEIVTLAQLSRLCKSIADIHGQYDHQSLLQTESHLVLIDSFRRDQIQNLKQQVHTLYHQYTECRHELRTLLKNHAEGERRKEFMKFELAEIKAARLMVEEEEQLAQDLLIQQHGEAIYQSLSTSYVLLRDQEPSCLDLLGKVMHQLSDTSAYAGEIAEFHATISEAFYKLEDLATQLRRYKESVSFSQLTLDELIARIDLIDALKRKYGTSIQQILAYGEQISQDLEKIENIDLETSRLEQDIKRLEQLLDLASRHLSEERKASALLMEEKINQELTDLNFKDALFSVAFQLLQDSEGKTLYTEDGIDNIEFLIRTNRGEVPKPLAKIASGGEISRIMLAFKRIIGEYDRIPTMIFDEIDSGISGITASIVGSKLAQIAQNHQIICITHLPQIAAAGDHHYRIDKTVREDKTYTTILPMGEEEELVHEIARLTGGIHITEHTLQSAREMIHAAKGRP